MQLITPVVWEKAMELVRSEIGADNFESWLAGSTLEDFNLEAGLVRIGVPNGFYRRWIQQRYVPAIAAAFAAQTGAQFRVELQIVTDAPSDDGEEPAAVPAPRRAHGAANTPEIAQDFQTRQRTTSVVDLPGDATFAHQRLNPKYAFADFVVGESNRYAHAAAVAVADPGSKAFNPLFIYGGSGLGKTHLMQAIGHRMQQTEKRLRILYVTSEQFINNFIDAIQEKKHVEFRAAYRHVDLLLIDDVQFLMGKERTQQEFFHTFNALYDAGKKVVVTSDRPPKDLSTLEERLRSRFEWGLLVDIQPPDLVTRIAILRKKADLEGVQLPADVITYIAERFTENVREMEGVLKRLKMTASLHNKPIDLATARELLGHFVHGIPSPRVSVEDVQKAVCAYFDIRLSDLLGSNRSKKFSQPRHLAQYLARQLTDFSFPDIAQKFGGKDHTSIIYACRKVDAAMQKDSNLQNVVQHLTRQVTKGQEN